MAVVDIARALAPGLPHRVVGIRPGEKIHEAMISSDDARNTVALDDRFVIEPIFAEWSRKSFLETGGVAAPLGFSYRSDNNSEWLDVDGLRGLMSAGGI